MTDVSQLLNRVPASSSPRPATRSTCTWCWLRTWACPEPRDLIGYQHRAHPFSSLQVIIAQGSSKLRHRVPASRSPGLLPTSHHCTGFRVPASRSPVYEQQAQPKLRVRVPASRSPVYEQQAQPKLRVPASRSPVYEQQAQPKLRVPASRSPVYEQQAHPFFPSVD